ncbi:ABC transporter substrate-binding protein [Agrobacterium sp.]|jgi:iron complex transport system substrate-binding protein|uniref:ABC transporter substrate-binding protein n=1 Tax=Agrobacterium sp. TaxID=361 RepID=UPI0028AA1026|nr:ABC transporter substrate-binding protein [Agrobacterium sp.]
MVNGPATGHLTRRVLLGSMASALLPWNIAPASAASRPRLAAIDWAMAETAAMLGHPPAAIAELRSFRHLLETQVPQDTVDLGLRGSPNLETLSLVGPDLILSSNYYAAYTPKLEPIAPVFSQPLFIAGEPVLPKVMELLASLAERMDLPQLGQDTKRAAADRMASLRRRVERWNSKPFLLIEIGDPRHVRIYGTDSLFGGMIEAIGLRNAWGAGTRFSFAAPVPMENIVQFPDAWIVITGDVPVQTENGLSRSALWNALPSVRAGRVLRVGDMNGFGGMPSALQFARELVRVLEERA